MTQPLNGIKVLDFSEHGFVPSGAAALGDFGADVIKIERPSGDAMRGIIASGMVAAKGGYDYLFELFNRNKRGIALDVEVPAGREVFERLVGWCDVYYQSASAGATQAAHEPDDIFAIKPNVVYAKGHGQGQRGPDAESGGFDAVSYWARGGLSHVLTAADATNPVRQSGSIRRWATLPAACSSPAESAPDSCTCCGPGRASSSTPR